MPPPFSPLGDWHTVSPAEVQAALRDVFTRWGLPGGLRFDNGVPWGSAGDLPTEFALWLLGLSGGDGQPLHVIWNHPRRCQANGIVERAHGVLKAWVDPSQCRDAADLAAKLTWAATMPREHRPFRRQRQRYRQSRSTVDPTLLAGGRPYDPAQEASRWQAAHAWAVVADGVWHRRVGAQGQISLYNRPLSVGRAAARTTVQVRLALPPAAGSPTASHDGRGPHDPTTAHQPAGRTPRHHRDAAPPPWYGPEWVITAADGTVLRRYPASELAPHRILALDVTHRKPSTVRRRRRALVPAMMPPAHTAHPAPDASAQLRDRLPQG